MQGRDGSGLMSELELEYESGWEGASAYHAEPDAEHADWDEELDDTEAFEVEEYDSEVEDLDLDGMGRGEKLYALSRRGFESELALREEADRFVREMELEYFLGSLKKLGKKALGKAMQVGKTALVSAAGQLPGASLVKGATSLLRGNLSGMLKELLKSLLSSAVPGGAVGLKVLESLGSMGKKPDQEAFERFDRVAQRAYEYLAENLPDEMDDPIVAAQAAQEAFVHGLSAGTSTKAAAGKRIRARRGQVLRFEIEVV